MNKVNNQIRREEFEKRRIYKGSKSFCLEGYDCPVFMNCLLEINQLKKQLYSPDLTITTCPKCGEKFSINYSREVYDLRKEKEELKRINGSLQSALSLSRQKYNNDKARYKRKYKKEHNILTQFETWLVDNYFLNIPEIFENSPVKEIYKKLQELKKEGKK